MVSRFVGLLSLALLSLPVEAKRKKGGISETSAAVDRPVTLPCQWEEGLTLTFAHERLRTNTQQPMLAQAHSTTPTVVTVVSSKRGASVFSYDTGLTQMTGPPEITEGIALIADFDMPAMSLLMRDGVVIEVTNYLEVTDATVPLLEATMAPDAPPEALGKTLAMFRNPDYGPTLWLRDAGKLFTMHCVSVVPGEVVESPMDFPNPFGGPPISGHTRLEVLQHDADAGLITMRLDNRTDPGALQTLLPSLLAQFGLEDDTSEEALREVMAQIPPITSIMVTEVTYSTADGFPMYVKVHQEVGAEEHPMRRTDTWIWTREVSP